MSVGTGRGADQTQLGPTETTACTTSARKRNRTAKGMRVALFNRCSDANASARVRFACVWAMVSPALAGWFRLRWELVLPASEDRSTRQLPSTRGRGGFTPPSRSVDG